ncbi:lipoprotein insertase outer membrane protein LolB [uncultured Abyssibacter sp.]|uniref:lipoprotein insertase outer membrane protein LolB n=1 Tax=uncultured Abyssibacter sp. TaxID=2320202 RepID=UPI0032B109DC
MTSVFRRPTGRRFHIACVAVLLLGGCTHWGVQPGEEAADERAWAQRQAALRSLTHWTLNGRIASTGLFGFSGRVRWQQADETFVIDVAGPFGAGATRLTGHPQQVEIRNADGAWVTSDPEGMLRDAYGWTLPLDGLQAWALGLPIDGVPAAVTVNGAGQLQTLEQAGWVIHYEAYAPTDTGLAMPQKLTVDNGETRWRVLVDRWTFPTPAGPAG